MIDNTRLAELRDEIGSDDLEEVVAMFCEEVEEALLEIEELSGPKLVEQLHFLKGSALNIGLTEVSTLCRDAESRLRLDPGAATDVAEIRLAYAQSKTFLLASL